MINQKVAVVMGSDSDYEVMAPALNTFERFGVGYLAKVLSAHRTPHDMLAFAASASDEGFEVIVAGAGGAAHLPGMVASATTLPVIGVPVRAKTLEGLDSLLSIVQMPAGVPVATVGINNATNAALLALRILAIANPSLKESMRQYQIEIADLSRAKTLPR
ncbi:5-(carboxyamino)imidazole ribonucleotide mutase [Ferrithrix thermotolerans DSM 19514]|uniref:N5-carboxyaminoimidazole ribonucleotide mutase n=1 Tax=Ferrithrix thermotolerans DSM 19514 TaxID=1121881 RepID=A0A1M4UM81_9ACTN|nr:5-(carboxyamino)imidazole ribonucleotide mutase [Ferrithrix thermotolerans]SHE57680.1 5-(carboxyamino)imidazole ribonucleotide mutase [Ferrithrix thermotolerans DSM 19514]